MKQIAGLLILAMLLAACAPPTPPLPTLDAAATEAALVETMVIASYQTLTASAPTATKTITQTSTQASTPTTTVTSKHTDTPVPTVAPSATFEIFPTQPATAIPPAGNCNAAYPDFCIQYDMTCVEIGRNNFTVLPPDPFGLDRDNDGIGCEKN